MLSFGGLAGACEFGREDDLERDAGGMFSAGPTLRRLAAVVHDGGPLERVVAAAQPRLDALAEEVQEAYLTADDEAVVSRLEARLAEFQQPGRADLFALTGVNFEDLGPDRRSNDGQIEFHASTIVIFFTDTAVGEFLLELLQLVFQYRDIGRITVQRDLLTSTP